jgi:hypothetical protein
MNLGTMAYRASLGINAALAIGGLGLLVLAAVHHVQQLASYEAQGYPVSGDVLRGPAMAIMTAALVTGLAGWAFFELRFGHRWACWLDAFIWTAAWFPAGINLDGYFRGFGLPVVTAICALGITLAVLTFIHMPSRNVGVPERVH